MLKLPLVFRSCIAIVTTIVCLAGCSNDEAEVARAQRSIAKRKEKQLAAAAVPKTDPQRLVSQATALANEGKYAHAISVMQNVLLESPNNPEMLFLTARLMSANGDLAGAVQLLDSINTDIHDIKMAVLLQSSDWLIAQGRLTQASSRLKQFLKEDPSHPMANRYMLRICNAQGRRFDSVPYNKQVIASGDFQLSDLAMLCSTESAFRDKEFRALMDKVPGEKANTLVYDAREKLITSKLDKADKLITEAVELDSKDIEAWVWFGHVKVQQEQWDALPQWYSKRPERFDTHPEFWSVMGNWLLHQKQPSEALRAFQRVLELDNRSITATHHISTTLIELEQPELAERFRHRACFIVKSNNHVRNALADMKPEEFAEVASDYQRLGDQFLADVWKNAGKYVAAQGKSLQPVGNLDDIPLAQEGGHSRYSDEDEQAYLRKVGDITLPPLMQGLASLNLPKLNLDQWNGIAAAPSNPQDNQNAAPLMLEEVAAAYGLANAQWDWGRPAEETWIYIYRSMGGGVAALDYDLDGYPDLYFSRAGGNPGDANSNQPKQFFRNLNGYFKELDSVLIGLGDRGFGQGLACGDYDQDGHHDVLVNNIGSCHLYRNNGDGTFELTKDVPLNDQTRWAAACTLADVNRDGLPDIYLATYFGASDYDTKKCPRNDTVSQGCPPQVFPGAEDVILLNGSDETWQDAPPAMLSGIIDQGRSLGVVVGDFDKNVGNEIYVANDETPNHYYVNQIDNNGKPHLVQSAGIAGVAVGENGRSQGSMGIAVTDIDHNGLDDIFVTNAMGEYNAMYMQRRANIFIDATRKWDLYKSALEMVGFGCVFSDMDNDGWDDLFVLNGNVDDHRDMGEGYKFLPQVYRNQRSSMNLVAPTQLKGYFEEPNLGRGLATLDFDLDHKIDYVITHCDRNTALIANRTPTKNHFIEFELTGVQCDRDAIGARIELQCGDRTFSDALYAGESFFSSCEKLMHIGLGNATSIDSATVHWPDGSKQSINQLAVDERFLILQGQEAVQR